MKKTGGQWLCHHHINGKKEEERKEKCVEVETEDRKNKAMKTNKILSQSL